MEVISGLVATRVRVWQRLGLGFGWWRLELGLISSYFRVSK